MKFFVASIGFLFFGSCWAAPNPLSDQEFWDRFEQVHPFGRAHQTGLTGNGIQVAVIESDFPPDCKGFDHSKRHLYDSTIVPEAYTPDATLINPEPAPAEKDYFFNTFYQLDHKLERWLKDKKPRSFPSGHRMGGTHATQVTGLLIGNQNDSFPGGCAPNLRVHIYARDNFSSDMVSAHSDLSPYHGTGLLSVEKTLQTIINSKTFFKPSYSVPSDPEKALENLKWVETYPIEHKIYKQSPLNPALKMVFDHIVENPDISIINASLAMVEFSDPFNEGKVPPHILDWMADGLARHDQILVLAAGNGGGNLTTTDLADFKYIRSLSTHPKLRERIVLALNISVTEKPESSVMFSGISISRTKSSNYPGEDTFLQQMTLAAIGNNIIYNPGQKPEDGTSLSAPVITAYLSLLKENNPGKSMLEIVEMAKKHAQNFDQPDQFGNGVINIQETLL